MEWAPLATLTFASLVGRERKLNEKEFDEIASCFFASLATGDFAMAHVPSGVLENPPHVQWPRNGSVTIFEYEKVKIT